MSRLNDLIAAWRWTSNKSTILTYAEIRAEDHPLCKLRDDPEDEDEDDEVRGV